MDKYILVTNANTPLGIGVVKKLISENFIVFAGDPSYENKKFGNLIYIHLDPSDFNSIGVAKTNIQKYTSKVNTILNIPNHYSFSPIIESDEAMMKESLEKNFFDVFRINYELWDLLEARHGKIINDCSDLSLLEFAPFNGLYSLSKSLLSNYSTILQREFAFKGIRVVKVHTGFVRDENYENLKDQYHNAAEKSKLFFNEMSRYIDLNLARDSFITIDEYSDFIVKIIKRRKVKKVYKYKLNKKLKKLNSLPKFMRERFFRKYMK